jgi:hypothetical protein
MLQTLLLNPNKEGRYQICLKDYIRSIHLIIVSKWCKFLVAQANWVACYILELFLHHYVVLTCFIVLKQPFWVHATIYEAPFVHWVITHLCACDDTRFSTTMLHLVMHVIHPMSSAILVLESGEYACIYLGILHFLNGEKLNLDVLNVVHREFCCFVCKTNILNIVI